MNAETWWDTENWSDSFSFTQAPWKYYCVVNWRTIQIPISTYLDYVLKGDAFTFGIYYPTPTTSTDVWNGFTCIVNPKK